MGAILPYIPADPQDIMAALPKVAPPPAGDKSTRKVSKQKRKAGDTNCSRLFTKPVGPLGNDAGTAR